MQHRSVIVLLALAATVALSACAAGDARERLAARGDSLDVLSFDTLVLLQPKDSLPPRRRTGTPAVRPRRLSPLADSLSRVLVFTPKGLNTLTAAARAKRLLLDLGRVDAKIDTPARRAGYLEAVAALAPVRPGDRFRVVGPWGGADALVTGFDVWNGRIVATLELPPSIDSLVRSRDPLVATAVRADTAGEIVGDTCRRDSVQTRVVARLPIVRDSLSKVLRADSTKLTARQRQTARVTSSHVVGCFGEGRVLLLVSLSANDYGHVREAAVLLDDAGKVIPVRIADFRFRAHRVLHAFDADGDGVDDIAALGRSRRVGGTEVLRFNPEASRFEYLTVGFNWES